MTETDMNTSNPYDGERRAGTVGFPLPGVEVRVVDAESGAVVGPGGIGVLEVRGPNVFSGYWRQPEKTAPRTCGRTASSSPATSSRSTTTATCTSSAGPRT